MDILASTSITMRGRVTVSQTSLFNLLIAISLSLLIYLDLISRAHMFLYHPWLDGFAWMEDWYGRATPGVTARRVQQLSRQSPP
jgi:hypothetical protein